MYNQLQLRRAVQTRGDPAAETSSGVSEELLRVLIVDDCRAAADTLSMLIGAWGHDVRQAYDGINGLALATVYQPDVLLLDIIMPNMSGLELALQIRQQARLKDCFMIAVTGRTDTADRLECKKAGIDLFLIKPVDPSILKTLLTLESEYVKRSRQNTAARSVVSTSWRQLMGPTSRKQTWVPYHVLREAVAP